MSHRSAQRRRALRWSERKLPNRGICDAAAHIRPGRMTEPESTRSESTRLGSLVLLRHGESTTNASGVFTGLLDVELTDRGRQQAVAAGRLLHDFGFTPRVVYTSELRRAVDTTALIVAAISGTSAAGVSVRQSSVLAERHYGALTGQSKAGVGARAGRALVAAWRNSSSTRPPPITEQDLARLRREGWPLTALLASPLRSESLNDVKDRVRPFAHDRLLPHLSAGEDVLVVAHGNSLRALAAELAGLDTSQLAALRIAAGEAIRCQVSATGVQLSRLPARELHGTP